MNKLKKHLTDAARWKAVVEEQEIVKNPELVKIRTIKKKFLDQISPVTYEGSNPEGKVVLEERIAESQILGVVSPGTVVFVHPKWGCWKTSVHSYKTCLVQCLSKVRESEGLGLNTRYKMAEDMILELPHLFED